MQPRREGLDRGHAANLMGLVDNVLRGKVR
jgi:hypothetical protein